jgi:hypothetical protein
MARFQAIECTQPAGAFRPNWKYHGQEPEEIEQGSPQTQSGKEENQRFGTFVESWHRARPGKHEERLIKPVIDLTA